MGECQQRMGECQQTIRDSAGNQMMIAILEKLIQNKKELIQMKKELIKASAEKVGRLIREIRTKHETTKSMFTHVKSKCNESLTTLTSQIESLDLNRFNPKAVPSSSPLDHLVPKLEKDFRDALMAEVNESEKTELASFHSFVVNLFAVAVQSADPKRVQNTTNDILNWESTNGSAVADNKKTSYYARPPMNVDKETESDQPILQAVICRIIRIIVENNKETDATTALQKYEHLVTSERQLVGFRGKNERERRIDITTYQSEEFLPLMLASMVQKPIEIKVGRATRGKFMKGTEKGRLQIVGHLGKRLEYCFHFGGVGLDSFCIGIALTTLSIEVIRMELSNVGSTDVTLDLLGTGLVPVQLIKDTEYSEGIKEQYVKEEGKETEATDGFVLLAGALKHEIPKDFGSEASIKQVLPEEQELVVVEYLGSGAFSNVVQLGPEEFMKIPKSAALATILEGEAKVLVTLSRHGAHPSIPRPLLLEGQNGNPISRIQTVIRGEISEVIGLRLNGVVGLPLHRLPQQIWQKHCVRIITNVYDALKYAHSQSIYHLDVRPGNIIVKVKGENEEPSVMLSDWGCSVQGKRALKAFHGCTPYAHDRLLGDDFHGRLGADLDFASLAYTIDHIKHHQLRWMFLFNPTNVCTENLDLRRELVREWLGQQGPGQEPSSPEISKTMREGMFAACRLNIRRSLHDKVKNPEENTAVLLEDLVMNAPTKNFKKNAGKGWK